MIAVANLRKNQFYCPACKNTTGIVQVFLPYACKLLFQVRAASLTDLWSCACWLQTCMHPDACRPGSINAGLYTCRN